MTRVTPEQAAAAAKLAVLELGGAFSDDPKTMRRARQIGLTGWAFYVAGRGGALGDVRADTVAAALGFIAPEAVQDGWGAGCGFQRRGGGAGRRGRAAQGRPAGADRRRQPRRVLPLGPRASGELLR